VRAALMASDEGEIGSDASPETDPLLGRMIAGRFLITERIARGGMASVYAATQSQLNRAVAIKVMRSSDATGGTSAEEFSRRFLREASILSRLQHPNLVTLIDYGQITELSDEHYYIAMEFLPGETLARRLRTRGRLSLAESIRLARQIGRGLREAHRQGVIHRDLKPSNIMLVPEESEEDIVKLIDFGIGKVVEPGSRGLPADDDEDMTRVGLMLGSPRYMAPEQIRGEAVEARTDLYALGIILFQALTGRVPFRGKSEVETLVAQCTLPPPPLEAYIEEPVCESLSELVADLLKKEASERPTIYEFLQRLASVEREIFETVGLAGHTLNEARTTIPPPFRVSSIPPAIPPPPGVFTWTARNGGPLGSDLPPPTIPDGLAASSRRSPNSDSNRPRALVSGPPTDTLTSNSLQSATKSRRGWWLAPVVVVPLLWLGLRTEQPSLEKQAVTGAVVAPAPARTSFVLRLDSAPGPARVSEGGVYLGETPLLITILRTSVSTAPRRFSLERSGYLTQTFEQVDSEVDVAAITHLMPVPSAPSAVVSSARRARAASPRAEATTAKAPRDTRPPERGLEINMYR
jgi:eukaryotic-like serine/threonine-protein kinase